MRAIVHCHLPSGGLPQPFTFLVHYINYGYQNTGFLKPSKIVASCNTFFFLNLKFFSGKFMISEGKFSPFPLA